MENLNDQFQNEWSPTKEEKRAIYKASAVMILIVIAECLIIHFYL